MNNAIQRFNNRDQEKSLTSLYVEEKNYHQRFGEKKFYLNQITHNSPTPCFKIEFDIKYIGCKGVGVVKEENRLLFSFSRCALEKN